MNVIFVTLGSPNPPDSGPRVRDYNIIKRVAEHHRVTVLSLLYSSDEIEAVLPLKQFCHEVDYVVMRPRSTRENLAHSLTHLKAGRPLATYPFYYEEMARKIRRAVTAMTANLVQIEHSFLAPYVAAIPRSAGCKAVLSLHNLGVRQYSGMRHLEMSPMRKAGFWLKWLTMIGWEARFAGRYDQIIAVSSVERELLLRANPNLRVSVIPNGCDTHALRPLPETSDGSGLLFVGTLGYPPNADAVLHFSRTIMPLIRKQVPDARFVVVGHRAPSMVRRLADRREIVLAEGVDDILPYYSQAKICVVPLRAGGGTRLKILEAMALGRPVVSTVVGCEGLELTPDRHLIVTDSPTGFADAVIRLLTDVKLRRRLSQNARLAVESSHDWSVICERLLGVYDEISER